MPKVDFSSLKVRTGSLYPPPYDRGFDGRYQTSIGRPMGITQFGVNHVRLEPRAMSSLRHWHEEQDEFLVVTEGTLVLVDDHGETRLLPGDCAAFPKGDANGHHIVNRSDQDGAFIVVGTHTPTETGWYADIDMKVTAKNGTFTFTRKDGSPIEGEEK